ncbi:MAG: peptidyl-prolyl cis-trans isomerase [Candidatus Binatia bacterium]|nr:MAG: peptidyl-prolyl cis-trans isomerase [Candidatus Binatia bacterium]
MRTVLVVLLLLFSWANMAPAGELALETEEQKTIYALGLAVAQSLARYDLSPEELEIVEKAIEDSLLRGKTELDLRSYRLDIQKLAHSRQARVAEREKAAGAEFLAKAAAEKGAKKLPSGLVYREIRPGTGKSPGPTDKVKVHYHGTLRDGTVFDSSVERGEPAVFALNRVIPCWTEGLQLMKVGGKSRLVCPPEIAYGDRGSPPRIPPGATLSFEVELLDIVE